VDLPLSMTLSGSSATLDLSANVDPQASGILDPYLEGIVLHPSGLPSGSGITNVLAVRDFVVASLATANILPYQLRLLAETVPFRTSDDQEVFYGVLSGYAISLVNINSDPAQAIDVTLAGGSGQGSNPTRVATLEGLNSTTFQSWGTRMVVDENTTLDLESKVAGAGATVRVVLLGRVIETSWVLVGEDLVPKSPLVTSGLWKVNAEGNGLEPSLLGESDFYWVNIGGNLVPRTL